MTNVFLHLIIVNREIRLKFKKGGLLPDGQYKLKRKERKMDESERKNDIFEDDSFSEEKSGTLAPAEIFGSDGLEEKELPAEIKNNGEEDRYYEIFEKSSSKNMGWSVAAMILGIASVIAGGFGIAGLVTGILAIVFAVISRVKLGYFSGKSVAGLILGIFGAVFGIVLIVVNSLMAEDFFERFFKIIEDATGTSGNIESDF